MIIKTGIAASSGIAIGRCYPVDRNRVFVSGYRIRDVDGEIEKLKAAVNYTSDVFDKLSFSNMAGKVNREIYGAYKLLLEDELFIGETESLIRKENINAEYALKRVRDNIISAMSSSDNDYMKDRVYDIDHIYQRMQRHMANAAYDEFEDACEDAVIISKDVTPSDIEIIIKKGIKGFAADIGGKNSHNSIIARSAGLVSVVGLKDIYDSVKKDDLIIIDGFLGRVIVRPDEPTLAHYEKRRSDYMNFIFSYGKPKDSTCKTADGQNVYLYANVENNEELTLIDVYGLKGVGLYRTEFIYMNNKDIGEEHQYGTYAEAAERLRGKEFILRTFDFGGDKAGKYIPGSKEENPAMGLRAVRYCLKYKDFFRQQLRAVLRAAYGRDMKMMIPMVSSVDELLSVRKMVETECACLKEKGMEHNGDIKIGIMVELPSAALSIDKFMPYADFFSVGTNDLVQYILGVDRNNPEVNHLYSASHPSVVSVLSYICAQAAKFGKDVSLCGEAAGDCRYLPMLLGLGFRYFSMNPRSSYMVRKAASVLNTPECEKLVEELLASSTVGEAENKIAGFNEKKLKDIVI